jgi:hypothetical protein
MNDCTSTSALDTLRVKTKLDESVVNIICGIWYFIISVAGLVIAFVYHGRFAIAHDRRRYMLCRLLVQVGIVLTAFTLAGVLVDITNGNFSIEDSTHPCYDPTSPNKGVVKKVGLYWIGLLFIDLIYMVIASPFALIYYLVDFPTVPPNWPDRKLSNHYQNYKKKREEKKLAGLQATINQSNAAENAMNDALDNIQDNSIVKGAQMVADPVGGTVGLITSGIGKSDILSQVKSMVEEAKQTIQDLPTITSCQVKDLIEYVRYEIVAIWYHMTHLNWSSVLRGVIIATLLTCIVVGVYSGIQVIFLIKPRASSGSGGTLWFSVPIEIHHALPCTFGPDNELCQTRQQVYESLSIASRTYTSVESSIRRAMVLSLGFFTFVTFLGTVLFSIFGGIGLLHYPMSLFFEFLRGFLHVRKRQQQKGSVFKSFDEAKKVTMNESKEILDKLNELRNKKNKKQKITDELKKQRTVSTLSTIIILIIIIQ